MMIVWDGIVFIILYVRNIPSFWRDLEFLFLFLSVLFTKLTLIFIR